MKKAQRILNSFESIIGNLKEPYVIIHSGYCLQLARFSLYTLYYLYRQAFNLRISEDILFASQ